MPLCGAGHDSETTDFCDVCGRPLDETSSPLAAKQPVTVPAEPCAQCGAARTGRFCEECGRDHASPLPARRPPDHGPPLAGWLAVVTADPDYYRRVIAANGPDAGSIALPEYCPERRFVLTGAQVRIGPRSVSRGLHPEIDLSGPPEDPGVSHLHAVFLARPGGGWSVLDPGSTNGTTINGADESIARNVAVPLADGDRVHVGAWTTITLHAG